MNSGLQEVGDLSHSLGLPCDRAEKQMQALLIAVSFFCCPECTGLFFHIIFKALRTFRDSQVKHYNRILPENASTALCIIFYNICMLGIYAKSHILPTL